MKKLVFRFGVGFATAGALLTLFVMLTITSDFGWNPHGTATAIRFDVSMMLVAPSIIIGRALGVEEGTNTWLWTVLAVVPDTIFFFTVGALTGLLAHLLKTGMNVDEPEKNLRELQGIIQAAWDRAAVRVGEHSNRLMSITDLPQDDRDLYLIHDVNCITCNAGMLAWIHYHHDEPGWIESAQAAFRRIGHPQVSEGLARGLQMYLAKRGSLADEDSPKEQRYVYDNEEKIYKSLYRHLSLRQYFSK